MSGTGALSCTATPMPTRAIGFEREKSSWRSLRNCSTTSLVTTTMSAG
jgi:hypothetical protein